MRQASCRAAATIALAVVMLFAWVIPAFAGTAWSNTSYFTCGSYGYGNESWVQTDSSGARAGTYIFSNPSVSRPAGWYGALARLYNDAGTLVKQNGYYYTGTSSTGLSYATTYVAVYDSYYSYGVSKSWTGTAYHGHATWTSPYQTY